MNYKAKIVGFEPSQEYFGWYHPLYAYVDKNGENCVHKGFLPIERTPFTDRKEYTLIENHKNGKMSVSGLYDSKNNKSMILFCACLVFPPLIILIIPYLIISSLFKSKSNQISGDATAVYATVVGHLRLVAKSKHGYKVSYRPVMRYQYKDQTYEHISNLWSREPEGMGKRYKLYISEEKQTVSECSGTKKMNPWPLLFALLVFIAIFIVWPIMSLFTP